MNESIDRNELVDYIHDEISANGTSSRFYGCGLDPDTGEYDAEAIADAIINGEIEKIEVVMSIPYPYNPGEYRISREVTGPRGGKKWQTVFSCPATGGEVTLHLTPGEKYKETYWTNGWAVSSEFVA